ncbi:hypothetical protein [Cellulomonas sp. URHB0016]
MTKNRGTSAEDFLTRNLMSRRKAWLVAAGVLLVGVAFGVVRYVTGWGLADAIRSGAYLVLGVGCGLTVNQVATRRRLRRRQRAPRQPSPAPQPTAPRPPGDDAGRA